MVHTFAWKQVKSSVSRTAKWIKQQQKNSLLNFETLQKMNIFI